MRVSIMMCAYNVEDYIDRAIQSILSQTYTDWELIVSDDGSKDNTIAIVKKYAAADSRIRLYEQPQNLGYIRNKNKAFTYATGELLTQLDADDTSDPTRLEKQVNVFKNNPEIKICGANYDVVDLQDKRLFGKTYEKDFLVTDLTDEYPFWFPDLMFKKELKDQFGMFSEYFNGIYGDDYHWTLRVNQVYPIYFVKDVLYHYRINPDSLTNNYNGNDRKLIAEDIMRELFRQRKETGTDVIEQGRPEVLTAFEKTLLGNKKLMAEKYRIWAAKAIDKKHWDMAKKLLDKSFALRKTNPAYYKTLLYFMRHKNRSKT